jgi:hypothetical protein
VKRIPVHKFGKCVAHALVDDDDRDMLTGDLHWRLDDDGYAVRTIPGEQRAEKMHRVVMNARSLVQVDHRNGNRLDNRRCNLRRIRGRQRREQAQNVRSHHDAKSRFRGVYPCQCKGRRRQDGTYKTYEYFKASVMVDGAVHYCGSHKTELEAALAVEARRQEIMPWAEPDPELQQARKEQDV